ncbi:unnamed protein product [Amoebophrya sp. A120]|nr:unnamed protein product [Amoebophrya sp. A120]|eukprot:GSA120T00022820001.1
MTKSLGQTAEEIKKKKRKRRKSLQVSSMNYDTYAHLSAFPQICQTFQLDFNFPDRRALHFRMRKRCCCFYGSKSVEMAKPDSSYVVRVCNCVDHICSAMPTCIPAVST